MSVFRTPSLDYVIDHCDASGRRGEAQDLTAWSKLLRTGAPIDRLSAAKRIQTCLAGLLPGQDGRPEPIPQDFLSNTVKEIWEAARRPRATDLEPPPTLDQLIRGAGEQPLLSLRAVINGLRESRADMETWRLLHYAEDLFCDQTAIRQAAAYCIADACRSQDLRLLELPCWKGSEEAWHILLERTATEVEDLANRPVAVEA